jgi:hypothetical protein
LKKWEKQPTRGRVLEQEHVPKFPEENETTGYKEVRLQRPVKENAQIFPDKTPQRNHAV